MTAPPGRCPNCWLHDFQCTCKRRVSPRNLVALFCWAVTRYSMMLCAFFAWSLLGE